MTLRELKTIFHSQLSTKFPAEEIDSFFYWLLEDFLDLSRLQFALDPEKEILKVGEAKVNDALARLEKYEPIQYITGKTEFYGLPFKVSKAVLIPRPETEELVEMILSDSKTVETQKILDIGTGSGCIAIALAKNLPESKVSAIDISHDALEIAKQNAILNEVDVNFMNMDILNVDFLPQSYDIIVSNPPYVRNQEKEMMKENVLEYEPEAALFVSDTNPLVFYKKIAHLAKDKLSPNGKLFFEINEYLGDDLVSFLKEIGFKEIRLHKDFAQKDRMISCRR